LTASKSLPVRPSLDALRKQAKKLTRDVAAGHADSIARVRARLPRFDPPLTHRTAQLVIAREYGFDGWQDLVGEVSRRLGSGLDWAAAQARRVIHDNDVERLKQLLAEYPSLLSWRGGDQEGGLVGMATSAYGDAGDPQREQWFTRGACAELLIDAGAVVMSSVCAGILDSRARGLLQLFHSKGVLPRTLPFLAALGDLDAVQASLDEKGNDLAAVNEAFARACSFKNETVASVLLERLIALDPELGERIDGSIGRRAFIEYFIDTQAAAHARAVGPWKAFVMEGVSRAAHDGDVTTFASVLRREPWLLGDPYADFQARLIVTATLNERADIVDSLLGLGPALLRQRVSPEFSPIALALTYAKTNLIPLLTRIWPLPDDLPHAAGMGDLSRVKRWFDESGEPALGDLEKHFPCNDPHTLKHDDLHWGAPTAQHVLDTALAFAVINRHFEVADFLLAHGADINTSWNSHEPASILHHLVFLPDSQQSMQFLIDRGIDMTIKDYRWNSTARGWAMYGNNDPKMAQWLEDAERERERRAR
jgi:hypothetical protein